LRKGEAGLVVAVPHPFDQIDRAGGHVQFVLLATRQGVEQSHADPAFGDIADHADELALRRDQLGGADQQREARRGALFGAVLFRLLRQLCDTRGLVHAHIALAPDAHPHQGEAPERICPINQAIGLNLTG
jgi:hypothetical protein